MYSFDSRTEATRARTELTIDNRQARSYSAYGLTIESQIELPEFSPLSEDGGRSDVAVFYGDGDYWIDPVRHERSFWRIQPREARFWFKGVAGFLIREGNEIVISPEPDVEESLLRMYVEGMMMACLLQQRGFYVLHASVVQIADYAVAFLGHVGAGKSTIAAALHARGHAVVTDDNAAISSGGPEALVTPAFPSVKVFPEIAVSLGYDDETLKVMHASQIKRARSVKRGLPRSALCAVAPDIVRPYER